ncbi:SAM-dependent methyltransferase [Streptomyces kronopolitis]
MKKVQRSPALRRRPERQVLAPYRGGSSVKASFPHDRVDVPSVPRVYDYQLGGEDNYAADRELADTLIRTADWLPRAAQINRAHGAQTAAHLADAGSARSWTWDAATPRPSTPRSPAPARPPR